MNSAIVSHVPPLFAGPGQFFLIVPPSLDPFLPVRAWPFQIRNGRIESLSTTSQAAHWLRTGDGIVRGPYGRPFAIPHHARRVLILAENADALARMIPAADALAGADCEVAVVSPPDQEIEHCLAPEIEFRAAEDSLSAGSQLIPWADLVLASGSFDLYDALHAKAIAGRLLLSPGWAQILLSDIPLACGTGLCHSCLVRTRRGSILACRDGPVMDLADWVVGQ